MKLKKDYEGAYKALANTKSTSKSRLAPVVLLPRRIYFLDPLYKPSKLWILFLDVQGRTNID